MKFLFRISVALSVLVAAVSCREKEEPELGLPVTYANIAGIWKASVWNGLSLDGDVYVYVEFTRRDHTFAIHSNIDSMYEKVRTGTFVIETDDFGRYVLNGEYDYGSGYWTSSYYVDEIASDGNSMKWISTADESDICEYVRVESLPKL